MSDEEYADYLEWCNRYVPIEPARDDRTCARCQGYVQEGGCPKVWAAGECALRVPPDGGPMCHH